MSGTPAISVVMAVRHTAAFLDRALQSLFAQSFSDFEIVLVDDGRHDGVERIGTEWARRDNRLRLVSSPRRGLVRSLALGAAESRGPLLARLDGDDEAMPERLALQHDFMMARPDVVLAGTWVETMDMSGRRLADRTPPTDDAELRRRLMTHNPFIHPSIMMHREAYERAGGYRVGIVLCEDFDLWTRMAAFGAFANIGRPLSRYRVHSAGLSPRFPVRVAIADACVLAARAAREHGRVEPFEQGRPLLRRALALSGASRADIRYRALKNLVTTTRIARLQGERGAEARLRRRALGTLLALRPADWPRGAARLLSSFSSLAGM